MNALELLKKDHRTLRALFLHYQKSGALPLKAKQARVEVIRDLLEIHQVLEEEILYPAIDEASDAESSDLAEAAVECHRDINDLLLELSHMKLPEKQFDLKLRKLRIFLEHHFQEEEGELFEIARDCLTGVRLDELGEEIEARRDQLTQAASWEEGVA